MAELPTIRIAELIQLTLLAASAQLAGCDGGGEPATCDYLWSEHPFEVEEVGFTASEYDEAAREAEPLAPGARIPSDVPTWDGVSEDDRCETACHFAAGHGEFRPDYDSWDDRSIEISTCQFEPAAVEDVEGGGTVSCSGVVTVMSYCGRRPLAWRDSDARPAGVREQLDAFALTEQASITAFVELAAQLAAQGAPATLVERCRAAARDECRHVERLVALGATVDPGRVPGPSPASTSRLMIAVHNAIEGCVAETWAALVARHQAMHAGRAELRQAYAQIADDEARHAQLAWDLYAWLGAQLGPSEGSRVAAARAEALARLETVAEDQALAVPAAARIALGLPAPRRARALARRFVRALATAAA